MICTFVGQRHFVLLFLHGGKFSNGLCVQRSRLDRFGSESFYVCGVRFLAIPQLLGVFAFQLDYFLCVFSFCVGYSGRHRCQSLFLQL